MPDFSIDFSQFHPLGHWPGTAYCRSLPGGVRNHLAMTWEFRRRDQVVAPLHKFLLCRLGRHDVRVWYTREGTVHPQCHFCTYTRLPSEEDIDNFPDFIRERPSSDGDDTST